MQTRENCSLETERISSIKVSSFIRSHILSEMRTWIKSCDANNLFFGKQIPEEPSIKIWPIQACLPFRIFFCSDVN